MGHHDKKDGLQNISIARPCSVGWDTMQGDDITRFCGKCKKNVYNISALTADDAQRLIEEKEGQMCVRLFRRKDGTVMTRDCPLPLWMPVALAGGAATSALLAFYLFSLYTGCSATAGEMVVIEKTDAPARSGQMGLVYATHSIPAGHVIDANDVTARIIDSGRIPPDSFSQVGSVIGKKLTHDVAGGQVLSTQAVEEK